MKKLQKKAKGKIPLPQPITGPGAGSPGALELPSEDESLAAAATLVGSSGVEILPPEDTEAEILPDEPTARDALIPYDPLQAYLREIARYPRLSREQEQQLALRYKKFGDIQAAYRLVSSNLWLVVKIAREYRKAARSLLDLIQEGNIGLMEAVKNFDPYREVRFPSYAVWWIKAYIIRYLIANWRLVKIGTTQAQRKLFFNLQKEKDRLERAGIYPGPKLLAEKLDVKESEILEMEQRLGAPDVSVDAPLRDDSESTLAAVLPAAAASAEELLAHKRFQELLARGMAEFSSTLNDKERIILQRRLLSEDKVTLQELANQLSLSAERIRQLESRIKEKLKDFFSERFQSAVAELKMD